MTTTPATPTRRVDDADVECYARMAENTKPAKRCLVDEAWLDLRDRNKELADERAAHAATAARAEAAESQLKTVLDREAEAYRRHDARVAGLEEALRRFVCSCPGKCERIETDRDPSCDAHDALASSQPASDTAGGR